MRAGQGPIFPVIGGQMIVFGLSKIRAVAVTLLSERI